MIKAQVEFCLCLLFFVLLGFGYLEFEFCILFGSWDLVFLCFLVF